MIVINSMNQKTIFVRLICYLTNVSFPDILYCMINEQQRVLHYNRHAKLPTQILRVYRHEFHT